MSRGRNGAGAIVQELKLQRLSGVGPGRDAPAALSPAGAYIASLRSPKSRRSQLSCLRLLAHILTGDRDPARVPWHRLTWEHTNAIRLWLTSKPEHGGAGYEPATVNRYLAALRGVLRACWRMRLLTLDDLERIAGSSSLPSLKVIPGLAGRRLSALELKRIFMVCRNDWRRGARDAAAIALMVGCGLRAAELASVQMADLDGDTVLVREGKGGKPRRAFAGPDTVEAVRAWLKIRGVEPGPLLCRYHRGGNLWRPLKPITEQSVWILVRARCAEAGLPKATPHDLRRTTATSALEAGADLAIVAKLLGHESVATTAAYDRRGDGALREAAALIPVPFGELDELEEA